MFNVIQSTMWRSWKMELLYPKEMVSNSLLRMVRLIFCYLVADVEEEGSIMFLCLLSNCFEFVVIRPFLPCYCKGCEDHEERRKGSSYYQATM